MNKLVEYSDDEEEVATVAANAADDEVEEQRMVKAGQGEAQVAAKMDVITEAVLSGNKGNGRASSRSQISKEQSILRLLGPPPKILYSTASEEGESSGSSRSIIYSDTDQHRHKTDPEWGLGLEKSSDKVDEDLFKKLAHFHTLKKEKGTHFNQSLNRNRSFHNPHIYSKLVQWVEVEETGSGYADMIKGGKTESDRVWPSSEEARKQMLLQGGKDFISTLQRKRQEESDDRKKKARRENLDFVGASKTSSAALVASSNSASRSEALALAESRAKKIRDDLVANRGLGSEGSDRQRRRDGERDRDRPHHHHQHSRRP